MKKAGVIVVILFAVVILGTSCKRTTEEKQVTEESEPQEENIRLSVWNVYWDNKRIEKEIESLEGAVQEICYFAAYFNSENAPFVPEEVTKTLESMKGTFKEKEYIHYLTFVNDKIEKDGSSSLKDTSLLYELLSDETRCDSHIKDIIKLTAEGGYDGIEIDYEAIKKDEKLWEYFIVFCKKLYEEAKDRGLRMRVVLEPSAPVSDFEFPQGPDYVMMCYNLYGSGTEPGPKADKEFILEMVEKMELLPGNKYFAFAAGGFDWGSDGKVDSLTEAGASELLSLYEAEASRDRDSQCMVFEYTDQDGLEHEVWFADGVTLKYWMEVVKEKGDWNFSLWRLGGNDRSSLQELSINN